jgi:3',5'-cyclic AMP phosphodiesterase CpdA
MATGKLGASQLSELERRLDQLGREGLFRVVLVHHPPLDETTKRRKRLLDSAEFRAVLKRAGAELVLHGHDHRFLEAEIEGADGPVPVFGVPSASALPYSNRPGAHYFLHDVEESDAGWTLTVRARGPRPEDGRFAERFTRTLRLERPKVHGKS